MRSLKIVLALIWSAVAFGQGILDPVKWDISTRPGNEPGVHEILFKAKVNDGWYVYSQFLEEDGPIPTTIYFDDETGFSKMGPASESGSNKVSEYDNNFEMELVKFKKDMTLVQRIKVDPGVSSAKVAGYIEFMTCDASRCLPPKAIEFSFDLAGSGKPAGAKPVETPKQEASKAQESQMIRPGPTRMGWQTWERPGISSRSPLRRIFPGNYPPSTGPIASKNRRTDVTC